MYGNMTIEITVACLLYTLCIACLCMYIHMYMCMCMCTCCLCLCTLWSEYYSILYVAAPLCVEGDVRLAENYTNEYDTYDEIRGYVEICTNGSFTPVCYNESLLEIDRVANLSCQQLGYNS